MEKEKVYIAIYTIDHDEKNASLTIVVSSVQFYIFYAQDFQLFVATFIIHAAISFV